VAQAAHTAQVEEEEHTLLVAVAQVNVPLPTVLSPAAAVSPARSTSTSRSCSSTSAVRRKGTARNGFSTRAPPTT
jgi:hypothetical protein